MLSGVELAYNVETPWNFGVTYVEAGKKDVWVVYKLAENDTLTHSKPVIYVSGGYHIINFGWSPISILDA